MEQGCDRYMKNKAADIFTNSEDAGQATSSRMKSLLMQFSCIHSPAGFLVQELVEVQNWEMKRLAVECARMKGPMLRS